MQVVEAPEKEQGLPSTSREAPWKTQTKGNYAMQDITRNTVPLQFQTTWLYNRFSLPKRRSMLIAALHFGLGEVV
jgi:hypothetical protein